MQSDGEEAVAAAKTRYNWCRGREVERASAHSFLSGWLLRKIVAAWSEATSQLRTRNLPATPNLGQWRHLGQRHRLSFSCSEDPIAPEQASGQTRRTLWGKCVRRPTTKIRPTSPTSRRGAFYQAPWRDVIGIEAASQGHG